MGSGKTTVGKKLSEKVFAPFYDLDHYIEDKEGATIADIFKNKGEIYFRKIEHIYLKEFLLEKEEYVLSLGGGTPCYAGNMELILEQEGVHSVYLQANIPTLKERISKNKKKRPLVAAFSDEKLSEFIAKHLFERKNFYEQAHLTISVNDKDVSTIVTEVRIALH
jgi:shikimate kinase